MVISKVSSKSQITLPREVCKALGLKPGDLVSFSFVDGDVCLRSLQAANAKALAGSLKKYARPSKEARSVRQTVREEVAHAAAAEG